VPERDVPLLKTYVGKAFEGVSAEVVNDELAPVAKPSARCSSPAPA
jgi:hypothetical protein